jgi:hypothetical protein
MAGQAFGAGEPYNIHYHMNTVLDYDRNSLTEHTSISFSIPDPPPDTLRFWRVHLFLDETIEVDSIFINGTMYSFEESTINLGIPFDSLMQTEYQDADVWAIVRLPVAGRLSAGPNTIDFFYRVTFGGPAGCEFITFPGAFVYGDEYPRLVHGVDSITSPDQRFYSYEEFSYDIEIDDSLYIMSQDYNSITPSGNNMIACSHDCVKTSAFFWLVFPVRHNIKASANGMVIDIFDHTGSAVDSVQIVEMGDILARYERDIGALPYEKINLIYAGLNADVGGGAAANFIVLPSGENENWFFSYLAGQIDAAPEIALPHELAHLWWGGAVEIRDVYLAEALAVFWQEIYSGPEEKNRKNSIINNILLNSYQCSFANNDLIDDVLYNYYVCPAVMQMLVLEVGDEKFADICRMFYQKHRFTVAGIKEFKEVVGGQTDTTIIRFLSDWFDDRSGQNYKIESVRREKHDTLYHYSLNLSKSGTVSSRAPVELKYADGKRETIMLGPENLAFSWDSERRLKSVFIDPDCKILETDRTDNAWPLQVKLYTPSINPISSFFTVVSYMYSVSTEPGYHIMLMPDIPSHSERFDWQYAIIMYGIKSANILSGQRNRYVLKVQAGYNRRMDSGVYSISFSDQIIKRGSLRTNYDLFAGRQEGVRRAGIRLGQSLGYSEYNWLTLAADVSRRRYCRLRDVSTEAWPERQTTPLGISLTYFDGPLTQSILPGIKLQINAERGLKIDNTDNKYWTVNGELKIPSPLVALRLFAGTSSRSAVQERYDPAVEGAMRGYSSFAATYRHMVAADILRSQTITGLVKLRLFTGYFNPIEDGRPVAEAGFGVSVGGALLGMTLDVPMYVSASHIDNDRWNLLRMRLKIDFLGAPDKPRFDFLIK